MKKFTKVCLITALIFFIIGSSFCGIFGVLGGFGQLDALDNDRYYRRFVFNRLAAIPFVYKGHWLDDLAEDDWDRDDWDRDDWDRDDWDRDDWDEYDWDEEEYKDMFDAPNSSSAVQTNYSSADITDIEIELGGENLIIAESEDDYVWINSASSNNKIKYGMKGSVFKLYSQRGLKLWWNVKYPSGKVYLYLPKEMSLDSIDLEVGAGRLESADLKADSVNLEIGAGKFKIGSLSAREADINIGAGKADINSITANAAYIEVGAGSLVVNGIDVGDLECETGMGSIDMQGKVSGDADIDCGMGSINIKLEGRETDYNYHLECAMGSISVGESSYSGVVSERKIDNNSRQDFEVECAMGNIVIDFY